MIMIWINVSLPRRESMWQQRKEKTCPHLEQHWLLPQKKPEATTRTTKAKLSQEKFLTAIIDLNEVQAREEEKL